MQSVSEAVAAARDGHFDQAFSYLFVHLDRFHRDTKVHAETLVVMEWAQRYEEAVVSALSRPDLQLPLYAVKSVVRSARRAGLHVDAEDFLQVGFAIAPDDPDLLSARIHLLGDQGQLDEGLRLANQAVQKYPLHADLWLAKYYLHLLRKDNVAALDAVERAVALAPSDYARRELIYSLERSGMPQRALELLQADPALVSADETFRLRRAANAAEIRWGSQVPPQQQDHYAETDQALSHLDALLKELKTTDLKQPVLHQRVLLFNRLVALRDRRYMQAVIDLWRLLVDAEIEVPDYALQAVADALLYLQRPEESALLYRDLHQRSPRNIEVAIGFYYSLHEANRYDDATEFINRLAAGQNPWNLRKGYRTPARDPDKLSADLLAGQDRLYRNELELAERQLGELYDKAPHNTNLRKAFGDLQSARLRPRRAQWLYEQGLAVEPKHAGLQAALADSFMVRRQWRLAEESIARLVNLYPDEGSSLRLQDEWQRHSLRILEGQVSLGFGDSPSTNGQEMDFLLRGWTRPLDYDWRLGAFIEHWRAKLPEGDAERTYVGGSFQRQAPDWSWFGQLGLADASGQPWYAELTGRYEPKDHWAAYFGLARNGKAVSLRALESGTGGTELLLGGEWWRHESLSAALEVSLLNYDDGNLRSGLNGSLRKRFHSGPTLILDNIIRIAGSINSQPGGFYFAPDAALGLEDEIQLRWITRRWYADTFTQRASISTGGYWQQSHGLSIPFGLTYAHEWELYQRRIFIEYGPSFSLHHYDGEAETNLGFYLAFIWRY